MRQRDDQLGFILLIEDDTQVAKAIGQFLELRGYAVDYAGDGITGLHLGVTNSYDVIILDCLLPGMNGLEVCRKLRKEGKSSMPILMLTGCDSLDDKVLGLQAGADDYLVKPFAMRELDARIQALIRRERRLVSVEVMTVADLSLNMGSLRLVRAGQTLTVSPTALKLLTILMRESPRVVSRQDLEREVWGDTTPDSDTLRSHLYHLRRVIDKPFAQPLLHTLPSMGYRIADLQMEEASTAQFS